MSDMCSESLYQYYGQRKPGEMLHATQFYIDFVCNKSLHKCIYCSVFTENI